MADTFAQEMETARAMVEARLAEFFTGGGLEEPRYPISARAISTSLLLLVSG